MLFGGCGVFGYFRAQPQQLHRFRTHGPVHMSIRIGKEVGRGNKAEAGAV